MLFDVKCFDVVRKHQRNEGYMAAWKETLLVIEWATKHQADDKIPINVRIASKEKESTAVHKSMQRNTENQMPNDIDIESKKRTAVVQSKQRNAK